MFKIKHKLHQLSYRIRHDLLTPSNLLVVFAAFVALSSVVSSIFAMQQNYELQKKVDKHRQQLAITRLETESLAIENEYYKSAEYQELAVRQSLGLGAPGEKILILPPYTDWVAQKQQQNTEIISPAAPAVSNFQQWINFLFGANRKRS